MKKCLLLVFALASVLLIVHPASGCVLSGYVLCDNNGNREIDPGDQGIANVVVTATSLDGTDTRDAETDSHGYFEVSVDCSTTYIETLVMNTLPPDAQVVIPQLGYFEANGGDFDQWLIESETCQAAGLCWLTGGGVKYEPITGTRLAERGAKNTFGGNVFPGCSPTAGEGGSWNHVAHDLQLHFHGTDIHTVTCGNVPGIPPGSESPVTPFNFIEYQGTGWLKGIKGNPANYRLVYFFARAEDRNEPGSNGAKDGAKIDRYFLHVWLDPNDPIGSTLLLIDGDGDPGTVDAVPISDGNLQIHISSCDNPPL